MADQRFETLDAMRGVAAIAVVCFHAEDLLTPITMQHAYLAVDFFFALSGLVLARSYAARFDEGMTTWQFFKMRAIRLYPLYLLGTLMGIVAVLWPMIRGYTPWPDRLALAGAFATSALMLPSPPLGLSPAFIIPFNTPVWSLFFEMAANLLLARFWPFLSRRVLNALLLAAAVVLILQAICYGSVNFGWQWGNTAFGIDRTLFSFLLGVWLARVLPLASVARRSYIAWLPLIALALTFLPTTEIGPWYDLACVILVFPALLWWGASVQPIGTAPFHFLGAISFAIYAIHGPVLAVLRMLLYHVPAGWRTATPWVGVVAIASLVLLAWAADRLDIRVRSVLRRVLDTPRSSAL